VTLSLHNDENEKILFIFDVDKMTPEAIHIEVSTAIQKEFDRMKDNKQG